MILLYFEKKCIETQNLKEIIFTSYTENLRVSKEHKNRVKLIVQSMNLVSDRKINAEVKHFSNYSIDLMKKFGLN